MTTQTEELLANAGPYAIGAEWAIEYYDRCHWLIRPFESGPSYRDRLRRVYGDCNHAFLVAAGDRADQVLDFSEDELDRLCAVVELEIITEEMKRRTRKMWTDFAVALFGIGLVILTLGRLIFLSGGQS